MIFQDSLETERLRVRPFTDSDVAPLVELFSDPEVARFTGDGEPLSIEDAALWVRNSVANLERFGYGTGAVVEKASGALVGWAGFARPDGAPEEVIYGFAQSAWRRGYATELLKGLVAFASGRGLSPVRATVDRQNFVSVRVLTRQGFTLAESDYGEQGVDLYVLANATTAFDVSGG